MKQVFHDYLFTQHLLVSDGQTGEHTFESLYALADLFNIRILSGEKLADQNMIRTAERNLGLNVPRAFYAGFPQSVRAMSPDQRLFDQLLHYFIAWVGGDEAPAGVSLLEPPVERLPFKESTETRDFTIVSEEEAAARLAQMVQELLCSTRPLSESQYDLVLAYIREFDYIPAECASKDTAVQLLLDTRDVRFAAFMQLSDVIRILDHLQHSVYGSEDLKKLNLRNQDRKFLTGILDTIFREGDCNIRSCFEKKKVWNGLLHHLHYKPATDTARTFVEGIRGDENLSVYAEFERHMAEQEIREAVKVLRQGKGSGALLRKLNYILSRCKDEADVRYVLRHLHTGNPILLIQLMQQFSMDAPEGARTFKFTRHNLLKVHKETPRERKHRQSHVPEHIREMILPLLKENLAELYAGKLGKVYIDPAVARYALPLQETASSGGYGVLPRGSRMPIPAGKKIRCFTYWEQVNDIDLSAIGITYNGSQREFSWRSMWQQSEAIVFSGDNTRGFHGGSEFFDVGLEQFREKYPDVQYLIFCNNVYSGTPFSRCLCKAGYMNRDLLDSGEIFEPKTVATSFQITCESTFAYLFAIDLDTREMVWLNINRQSNATIAGATDLHFLTDYLSSAALLSLKDFFTMLATEVVTDPAEAEVIVSDAAFELAEGTEQIHSYDTGRLLALMNS